MNPYNNNNFGNMIPNIATNSNYPQQPGNYPQQPGSYPQQPGYNNPNYPSGSVPNYPGQSNYPTQPGVYPNLNQSQPGGYQPYQQQPYPNQQYNQPGYPAQSGGYPPQPGYNNQPGYNTGYNAPRPFDDRMYFRKIFDDIDVNRDGTIGPNELHEALRRGQPNSQFDQRTVAILMEKYDKNRNGRITFDEFFDLFAGINAQYNEFLDVDTDFSGLIDNRELGNALMRRGYNLSPDTMNYISYEISRRNNINGINFDLYVRVIARFDFLREQYNRPPNNQMPFEQYIRNSFF